MGAASFSAKFVVRLAALLALAAAGVLTLSAAPDAPAPKAPDKPARPPEEEDPDAKPITHHVTSDEPDDSGAKTTAPAAPSISRRPPATPNMPQFANSSKNWPCRTTC